MSRKCNVGGQAVIEGVMMRGSKGIATAVRKPDGKIIVDMKKQVPLNKKNALFSLPIIRGFLSLVDSLIVGIKTLNFSASFFEDDGEESSKTYDFVEKIFKDKTDDVIMGFTTVLSIAMSILLFVIAPTWVAQLFKKTGISSVALNFIEGIIRVAVLIGYMAAISRMDDIYRLFQYHGAEHKTIFCYEAEEDLTVENVKKFGRFHPRCGTNFLFLVAIVSIILFSFTGWGSIWERIALRILMLPIVSGVTFEIIKWLGKSDSKIGKIIAYPGLKLQRLTTREPDSKQIEVAIASLKAAEGIIDEKTIGELLNHSNEMLKKVSDTYILDGQLLMEKATGKDKVYIITNRNEKVSKDEEKLFMELVEKRKKNMPVQYILGHTEFMGLDFHVEPGVLVPRNDTEILVEKAMDVIKSMDKDEVHLCDLCCGSGAIGLSIAENIKNVHADLIDIEPIPEKVTNINIKNMSLGERCRFIHSDLLNEVMEKRYDILTSNPPYIKSSDIEGLMKDVKDYEPLSALDGGNDGLYFYRKICEEGFKVLNDGGYIVFEIGYDQGEDVKNLLEQYGFESAEVIKDLAGKDRVVMAVKPMY